MDSEQHPPFYLKTKLLPPRPAAALLPRPRLVERLVRNLSGPLTLVTANAGSGKTTLVAEFVREHAPRLVWYQLDRTDSDPAVFLGYLATGIARAVPGCGDATLAYVREEAAEVAARPERATDVLLNEVLDAVDERLVLVLDDYHHLAADTPVHRAVERLLAYLPETVHTVVVSRDVPPIGLSRLRASGAVEVIGRADLLFTDEETRELFRTVFDLELTPEQLSEYRERTQGWITALQLVRQVAHRTADEARPQDLAAVLRQSERDIFEYFAEEVFAGEPAPVQELLVRASLLDRVDVATCAALFPELEPEAALPDLVRRNVFVTAAGDGGAAEYRFHPLFRGFLRRRLLSSRGPAGVAAEHRLVAGHLLAAGIDDEAARHLVEAGAFAEAAEVVAARGAEWIAAGALDRLVSLCEAVPEAALEGAPRALLHRAEAARLRGELDLAKPLLSRAEARLSAAGDDEGRAEALHALAAIARRQGDLAAAFGLLDRASALAPPDAAVQLRCANTRGLCLVASGEWAPAEREFRRGLELAEARGDRHFARLLAHNLGLPAMMRGDFGEALKWLRRLTRGGGAPAPQEATAHLNTGRCLVYRGALDEAERHLDRALEICQLFNLASLRGEIFEAYGNLARERGDRARAAEFYARAERAYEEAGVDLTARELLDERATLLLERGDTAAARAAAERLASARAASGDEMGRRTAGLTLGRILVASGDAAGAREELEPAAEYFRRTNLYYYEANACFGLAACDASEGRHADMLARLRRAVDLALRFDYEYWLAREVGRAPHLFATEDAAELLPADVRPAASAPPSAPAAPAAAPAAEEPAAAPVDLSISVLGPVEIVRDPTRPLAPDAWPTRRARDILCFVATSPHRRASKDRIVDTFWRDTDAATVEKNFHPTVSHIRKALNSNQPLKQNFLVFRDGDYMLNPNFVYRVDAEEFDAALAEGDAARRAGDAARAARAFERAADLYRGPFMQGVYEPWVDEQRAYYEEQYLRALEALASAAARDADWPRALGLADRILKVDPFREDLHRLAMRAHAALGNRGAVRDRFESLTRVLRDELGVDPEPETRRVFDDLMR